ncbi:hypothetical protein BASA62_004996 [Batrachochytrium salamandrivorans]|nr:hypothetical protein BASA62_004996 [Batrachochytrium salamandrivorans]
MSDTTVTIAATGIATSITTTDTGTATTIITTTDTGTAQKVSSYAVQWAIDNILRKETDQVVLLHVRSLVTMPDLNHDVPFADFEAEDAAKRDPNALLINTAKILIRQDFHVRVISLRGDALEDLVYKINNIKADMVVMGSWVHSAISRLFLGSVSEHLIHKIKYPVIIARDSTI